ncbi:MAG: endonuclease/exonuclease/phosphatase family protein [Verrucomicrobiaceae bacterium]|nr:MAG: endonuclease/exonuclease/phosphatase family protein [Verrucomicrobiaceae bacterium]
MRFRAAILNSQKKAPRILGAFFLASALALLPACRKSGTPDWEAGQKPTDVSTAGGAAPKTEAKPVTKRAPAPSSEGLRFVSYNVQNWLTMERRKEGKVIGKIPKPENEKKAVIDLLTRHSPDIVGLCEVGSAADLAELRERLKAAGVDLPHSHYTGGSDPTRHLGLLSRFPILSTAKPVETEFRLAGQTFAINRGILDATVDVRGKPYRFVGVHLKSKRESEQGDQEAMRLHEARLLRRHLDSIFKSDPDVRLVVYGDMNDTPSTPVIKTVTGRNRSPESLIALPLKDSRKMAWTHHWALHDIYSRVDFVMVAKPLRKNVDLSSSKVIDDEDWDVASDHRPVLAVFK